MTVERSRILWGFILAPCVVLFILFAPVALFKGFIVLVTLICLREFMTLALPKHPSSSVGLGILLGGVFSAVILFWGEQSRGIELSLVIILFITFTYYLFVLHELSLVFFQVAITVFGCLYVSYLFSYAGLLRERENGVFWIFLTAGTTFMADASAYFLGHLFGKHKLAPQVSPGKTIEGFVGGVVGSLLAAFLCRAIFWTGFRLQDCFFVGILVGFIGPLGDLSESLIKRSVGVKDSGHLIPGHGGLLDRLDALFFTTPVIYYYAKYLY